MEKRIKEIYDVIVATPNLSEREIAERVGLKPTPYTRKILLEMWKQAYIVRWLDDSFLPARFRYFVQLTEPLEGF